MNHLKALSASTLFFALSSISLGQTISFVHGLSTTTGNSPEAIAVGDFNNDGHLDIVTADFCGKNVLCNQVKNPAPGTIGISLGNGDGTFQPVTTFNSTPGGPISVVVGDFNGDGNLDIATANWAEQGSVNIFFGNGDGTFLNPVSYAVPPFPQALIAGHFVKNGRYLDLAVASSNCVAFVSGECGTAPGAVTILLGQAGGTFVKTESIPTGPVIALAPGDFNGDGNLDLVATEVPTNNHTENNVHVLTGDGTGKFTMTNSFNAGSFLWGVKAGNLGGGHDDLVIATWGGRSGSTISVYKGNGDSTFQKLKDYNVGFAPNNVVLADLNHDGNLDIAVSDLASGDVSILLGNGDETFKNAINYGTTNGPTAVAVGDFNGDGKLDIATADAGLFGNGMSVILGDGTGKFDSRRDLILSSYWRGTALLPANISGNSDIIVLNNNQKIDVFLANASGSFAHPDTTSLLIGPDAFSGVAGNFGHGLHDDVVVANYSTATGPGGELTILSGTTAVAPVFTKKQTFPLFTHPYFVAKGYFHKAKNLDLVLVNPNENSISILLGNGDATFGTAVNYPVANIPYSAIVVDINNDNIPDIVVSQLNNPYVSVFLGKGDGTFKKLSDVNVGVAAMNFASGDFDLNGTMDLAITRTDGSVAVLSGNGKGGFQVESTFTPPGFPTGIVAADFNGDGYLDLVTSNCIGNCTLSLISRNTVSVFQNQKNGQFNGVGEYWVGDLPIGLIAGRFTKGKLPDLAVLNYESGTVSIMSNDTKNQKNKIFSGESSEFPVGIPWSPKSGKAGRSTFLNEFGGVWITN